MYNHEVVQVLLLFLYIFYFKERIIEINAIVNGAKIIPHPLIFKPKYGPKIANSPPFKRRPAIPKVQTKNGINIFVRRD